MYFLFIYVLQATMSEATSRRIRAVFNTFNFWCIVLYNGLALTGLDFAKLVAKRLLLKGADLVPSALIFLANHAKP